MAMKRKRLFYKLILVGALALLTIISFVNAEKLESLALDQRARCGMQEHTHTADCYLDGVMLCKQKAHIHNNNCYLVLLQDNDINSLLDKVLTTEDRSLEGVLNSAVGQALVLNDSFTDDSPPITLTPEGISSLNSTITENAIEPSVVLNENLQAGNALQYTPQAYGATVLDVGDTPSTGNTDINFYIQLDGEITYIGSGTMYLSGNKYCYDESAVASLYNSVVESALTANNIDSTYFIRYNTTGRTSSASDFGDTGSSSGSRVQFGNGAKTRYALLCTRSRSWLSYTYTPVSFYTVTLDHTQTGQTDQVEYVQADRSTTLTLDSKYIWFDESGNEVTTLPNTITKTTTRYAKSRQLKAEFFSQAGTRLLDPFIGEPTDGVLRVYLPSLAGTPNEGWIWVERDGDRIDYFESNGYWYADITKDTVFEAIPSRYTVTQIDDTGQTTETELWYRETVTLGSLPEGWTWVGSDNSEYSPGAQINPVTIDVTFTATPRTLDIYYDVNFPSNAANSVDAVPTIYGTESSTATDKAVSRPLTVRELTSRTARREVSSGNKESVTYYFKGWQPEGTDILIPPDTTVSWSELLTYASEDDEVNFLGVWEEGNRYNSATFFVRFDSAAVDINGNITSQPSENYTPEVFNTHVGGIDTSWSDTKIKEMYEIADTTSDNSFTADQNIRALYGEKSEGMWLYDFPSNDYIFEYLKNYLAKNPGKQLTYDGVPVLPEELNHDYYAIRWYVCKLEGSTWHIDGKVYKKEGSVTIDKTFGGDDTVLQAEKDSFYILAENGELNADGTFVPNSPDEDKFKQYLLVVNQTGANALRSMYPNAQILVFDSEWDNAHHYEWVIDGLEVGEYWHIEEYPVVIPGYVCYSEYSVYDTDGSYTAIAEYGTRASMIGKTFALDEDPDQGLMVDFRNYYYPTETILIKKEDGKTGKPIGGAVFELWQNGKRLTFNYNEDTGQYERDAQGDGLLSRITTSSDGYSVISTTGFSYSYGDVIVKEVLPPNGYDPAPDITIGFDDAGQVVLKDIAGKLSDDWAEIAAVPSDDVLVVKNHAAEFISVTAEKVWNTNAPADSVEVVLQANGQHAAALFPGMTNAQVKLNAANYWSTTWTNLPRYANGQLVQWSVKEVLIGGKPTLADGVTFANWTVTYSPGIGTDNDGDGDVDNWKYIITNSTRRLQMILTKVGTDGKLLPGSVFSLIQVEMTADGWQPVAGAVANIQTTDANGMLTFDNLAADTYYRLEETQAPDGYFIVSEPVVLTMDVSGYISRLLDDGTLAELYDPLIQVTGPYNIKVVNLQLTELPVTGGIGQAVYIQSGALLILIAAALMLYKHKRRKEGTDTS